MPKGLGSKTVNYNISNKRQLVRVWTMFKEVTALLALSLTCWLLRLTDLSVSVVGRHGLWNVLSGPSVCRLDDCASGEPMT